MTTQVLPDCGCRVGVLAGGGVRCEPGEGRYWWSTASSGVTGWPSMESVPWATSRSLTMRGPGWGRRWF